jgi:23S rRNA G2445 N2-methylase RlmL
VLEGERYDEPICGEGSYLIEYASARATDNPGDILAEIWRGGDSTRYQDIREEDRQTS